MTYKDTKTLEDPVVSIATSDLYLSPTEFSAGTRFLIIDSDDGSAVEEDPVLRGSYSWEIQGAPTQPSSGALDVTGTMHTLLDTKQNFYGIGVHETLSTTQYNSHYPIDPENPPDGFTETGKHVPWRNDTGDEWTQLVNFLEASKNTDIKVFAVLGKSEGLGNAKTDVWGHKGGYWGVVYAGTADENLYHESCPAEHPDTGATKYAFAASEMSKLSLDYPNFIGISIDDFVAPNLNRLNCAYKTKHVKTIQAGAASYNPNFEFWPTHYVGHALMTAIPSTIIGFTYGMPATASEKVYAEHTFRIPQGITIEKATLNMLFDHNNPKTTNNPGDGVFEHAGDGNFFGYRIEDVFKGIYLNDTLIFQQDFSWDKRVQVMENLDIASHIVPGTNTLKFMVSGSTNRSANVLSGRGAFRIFKYGDIRIRLSYRTKRGARRRINLTEGRTTTRSGRRMPAFIRPPTFYVNDGTLENHHAYYKYNPVSSPSSSFTGRIAAETNDEYRYLEAAAGALAFYPNFTGTIEDNCGQVFISYRRNLPRKRIIHGQQSFLFEMDAVDDPFIKVGSHVRKFKKGSRMTDGQLLWNYPAQINSSSRGIFSERRGNNGAWPGPQYNSGDALDVETLRAQFLSNNLAHQGQYQRFVTKNEFGPGTLYYDLNFNGGTGTYFGVRILPSASLAAHQDQNVDYFKTLNITASGYTGVGSVTVTASTKIAFDVFQNGNYGNSSIGVQFSGSFTWSGAESHDAISVPLSHSAWDFESWYSSSYIPELYNDFKTYYTSLDGASYHNQILEKKSDGTWKVIAPVDGQTILVREEGKKYTYDADDLEWKNLIDVIGELVVSGTLAVDGAISREGIYSSVNPLSQEFIWTSSHLSESVDLPIARLESETYYEKTDDHTVKILQNGTYKINYAVGFVCTSSAGGGGGGRAPTGSQITYIATSSALVSDPWPPYILEETKDTEHLMGLSGSFTLSSHSRDSLVNLYAGDELKLYVERDIIPFYSNATGTVGTRPITQFTIEKVK